MSNSKEQYDWQKFEIEQTGANGGHCDCCGTETQNIWGFVYKDSKTIAAYFVSWIIGKPNHGASFDLVLGKWGDSTNQKDRYTVALDYRIVDRNPSFMIVDSSNRRSDYSSIASTCLNRKDVIGTPLAQSVFAVVDAVYMSDKTNEIRSWHE